MRKEYREIAKHVLFEYYVSFRVCINKVVDFKIQILTYF